MIHHKETVLDSGLNQNKRLFDYYILTEAGWGRLKQDENNYDKEFLFDIHQYTEYSNIYYNGIIFYFS